MTEETGLILPDGSVYVPDAPTVGGVGPGHVLIDNRTDLPDEMVQHGVYDYFVENASLAWGQASTFQTYANEGGSLLARTKFTVPSSVFGEIALARDIAEKDDDIKSALGAIVALAYSGGMQNFHEDERTVGLFNEMARNANLDHWLQEMLREYLIASQCTTVNVFTRARLTFSPQGTQEDVTERVAAPLLGVLQAEQIRVVDSDMFGGGTLAYVPNNEKHRRWLEAYFNPQTTAGQLARLREEDPVSAALFTGEVTTEDERDSLFPYGLKAYKMNPRMAQRFTMPKGSHKYPRPLLTANFALIEAKRMLNIMDYALLQGGANFIVVAKKGTDQHKASPEELRSLGAVVQRASRTGVIVGDHRLSFEIITPKLDELLNAQKRQLIARKLVNLVLRVPEMAEGAAGDGVALATEIIQRVITNDRSAVKRHVEGSVYEEAAKRNSRVLKGSAKIWHPAVVLSGSQYFTDYVLKLRDRGDIPRKWAVEAAGFDWEAGVEQRKAEKAADKIMVPAAVPFDSPNGRPPGTSPNNGAPGAAPGGGQDPFAPKRVNRGSGEPVRAWWDEDAGVTVRVGEITYRLLETYPDREEGRMSKIERRGLEETAMFTEGTVTVIPVNQDYEVSSTRLLRLAPGISAIVGYRTEDSAIVAKALCLRAPEFTTAAAEDLVVSLGWGRDDAND